ncbi:MAG: hypothetical protein DWQ05_07620 [Calditrichaeota bacterium]|nr:MAG: hypothetical protein DWQ05_07620 [Calditrichota bacterium]
MKFIRSFFSNRIFEYLIFWSASYVFLVNTFQVSARLQQIDYVYAAIFQATLMIAVHANLHFLIPYFLLKRRYVTYTAMAIALTIAATWFNILVFDKLIDLILPGYYFISYYSFFDISKFFAGYILATTLLKLSKEWFQLAGERERIARMQKEKTELALKALRLQVNPHFLFNSLNVLYSLALKKSAASPDAIIKLSDILRYVIYKSDDDFVDLRSEIKLIHDYIDLQKYRTDAKNSVQFTEEISSEELKIAPMILLPLVENSFKHGIKGDIAETFIRINLQANEKIFLFKIENNRGTSEEIEQQNDNGIGLINIRERLDLIYPGRFNFEIRESKNTFSVKLEIHYEN